MQLDNIMNLFSDMLIIIRDERGKIVYPDDPQLIQYAQDLRVFGKQKDELVHPETNLVYKAINCTYKENGKTYLVS